MPTYFRFLALLAFKIFAAEQVSLIKFLLWNFDLKEHELVITLSAVD